MMNFSEEQTYVWYVEIIDNVFKQWSKMSKCMQYLSTMSLSTISYKNSRDENKMMIVMTTVMNILIRSLDFIHRNE